MKIKIVLFLTALLAILPWKSYPQAQLPIVAEAAISPSGNRLAFILDDGERPEILLYDFSNDRIERLTSSEEVDPVLAFKSSLNWVNDNELLFLSKHTGIYQQYAINIAEMTMTPNGSSRMSEYDMVYSADNNGTYYLQFAAGGGLGIFFRPIGADMDTAIYSSGQSFTNMKFSPDGSYASVQVSPEMNTILIDIEEGQRVRTKLPSSNTILLAWSPDNNRFIYSEARYNYAGEMTEFVSLYDVESRKSTTLSSDSASFIVGAIWAPCTDKFLYVKGVTCILCDNSGNVIKEMEVEGRPLCWMPDLKTAVFTNGPEIFLFDTETGTQKYIY